MRASLRSAGPHDGALPDPMACFAADVTVEIVECTW